MPEVETHHIICYVSQWEGNADHVWKAFLTEEAAHEYWAENGHLYSAATYEDLVDNGGVVYLAVPERDYRKIAKAGLFFAAFNNGRFDPVQSTRYGYSVPFAVSSSKAGLVKKAREGGHPWTESSLFRGSSAGGAYLAEGHAMPPGYEKWSRYSGALVSKRL